MQFNAVSYTKRLSYGKNWGDYKFIDLPLILLLFGIP